MRKYVTYLDLDGRRKDQPVTDIDNEVRIIIFFHRKAWDDR